MHRRWPHCDGNRRHGLVCICDETLNALTTFVKKGYINGYEDSTFRPDNSMTRAEFVKVVNKVFGYTETMKLVNVVCDKKLVGTIQNVKIIEQFS